MIVTTDSEIWRKLFNNIRNYMMSANVFVGPLDIMETYENFFTKNNIRVIYSAQALAVENPTEHSDIKVIWEFIELPDGDELIHLILKWG